MLTNNKILKFAQNVMKSVGPGHSESVYQCALVSLFFTCGIPAMTEVFIPYMVNGICVGMGRADILTNTYLIELKANQKENLHNVEQAKLQLIKYLKAMHLQGASPRKGILLLFNTPSNGLYEKRITMINVSHEDVLQSLKDNDENGKILQNKKKNILDILNRFNYINNSI